MSRWRDLIRLSFLRPGARALKTTLAIYFLPISVLPVLLVSFYATRLLEESAEEGVYRKVAAERDAWTREFSSFEKNFVEQTKIHAQNPGFIAFLTRKNPNTLKRTFESFRPDLQVRLYTLDGKFLTERLTRDRHIPYLSNQGKELVLKRGSTINRYPSEKGLVYVARHVIRDKLFSHGILEEELSLGDGFLRDFKTRRQVDIALLDRELRPLSASFAVSKDELKTLSEAALKSVFEKKSLVPLAIGEARFATFIYELPGIIRTEGLTLSFALFLPLTASDTVVTKIRLAMIYVTLTLILTIAIFIFFFSRRLVEPIESLVFAMKRVKSGKNETIPYTDAPYEIEYLVRSFNEMTRNITAAKRALELKLEELRDKNQEIKETQGHLIQSAKMISLGELVAGVAHELNNPIGFIYSNMLHMTDYVKKIRQMISAYREGTSKLPSGEKEKIAALERDLEIDYILGDMEELTQSCVDGANRTKDIVLGLRTFSRMDESTFRETDIHECLKNTLKLLSGEFRSRIKVHEEYGDLPSIECNASQMNQVFMNLLSNAVHAISDKGDIWIRTHLEDGVAVIEIEDSGQGMHPEILEKIFDPFFTTKKVGEGTGLGLSIAYGLIQKHKGSIAVKSVPKKGSQFTVRIPRRQSSASSLKTAT